MIIETVLLDKVPYKVGDRMKFIRHGEKIETAESIPIKGIEIEATGQLIFVLSGDKFVMSGNTPYTLYASKDPNAPREPFKDMTDNVNGSEDNPLEANATTTA